MLWVISGTLASFQERPKLARAYIRLIAIQNYDEFGVPRGDPVNENRQLRTKTDKLEPNVLTFRLLEIRASLRRKFDFEGRKPS